MSRMNLDLWKLDPNWKFAIEHGEASKPGIVSPDTKNGRKNSILMCPCCLKVIHKEPVNLWENPKELHFLGYGFPLFYNMINYCYISLFILILSSSAIELYLSLNELCEEGNTAELDTDYTYPCTGAFVRMSRVTPNPKFLAIDRLLRSLAWIGQAFLLLYFRDVQRKLDSYHHERNTRIKDFSVLFKNLPEIPHIQKVIREFLTSLNIPLKIEEIFLIPKIEEFYEKEHKKKGLIKELKKAIKEIQPNVAKKNQIESELQNLNQEMINNSHKIEQEYRNDTLLSEKAIIILETKEQKRDLLEQFQLLSLEEKEVYFSSMAEYVTLESAPEPREIIWEFINYPKYKRWLRVTLGWGLSIVFLGIVLVAFYFWVEFKAESHSMGMIFGAIILIQFFNKFIMKIFLHWFCDMEKPETSSDREFSYAFKYTIGMFFTTAIMAIIVEALIFENIEFAYGVVESETIMFFFNAFIVNILWILHPQYYAHKFMRWLKFGRKDITQKEANELMEDFPYDMGKRYAEILETMWFTFLYSSLIPFGAFLTLAGLMIYYWVDKYNLVRRSKIENLIESKLPLTAVKLMEFTLFWKPLGELIFDIKLRGIIFTETYVMLGLGILYLFIPWNMFLDKFFHEKFNLSKETYQEVKYQFHDTYQTVDPIQRMLALEKFVDTQNKARLSSMKKASYHNIPSFLEIRDYENEEPKAKHRVEASSGREIIFATRPTTPLNDNIMIRIESSEKENSRNLNDDNENDFECDEFEDANENQKQKISEFIVHDIDENYYPHDIESNSKIKNDDE